MQRGRFFRGDSLARVDDDGRQRLIGLGLSTVVDLREDTEVDLAPDALDGTGIQLAHHPLFRGLFRQQSIRSLQASYEGLVDNCGERLAGAVGELARPGALPALVHCSAGKDRTGIIVAMVQSVVGVSDEDIAADYSSTALYVNEQTAGAISRNLPENMTGLVGMMGCPPELILDTLGRIRGNAGSVEDYLFRNGLTEAELTGLRESLTAA